MSSHPPDCARAPGDLHSLERLRRFGGTKLLEELLSLYFQEAPTRLAAARRGVEVEDAAAVQLAVHSLKSSSAQLGALHVQQLCQEAERLALAGVLGPVRSLLDAVEGELGRYAAWVAHVRDPS